MIKIRAIQIHQYEAADLLTVMETAIPSLQNNEVLVAVHYSGVNPIDIKIRSGCHAAGSAKAISVYTRLGISGIVEQVGSSITKFKKGDAVYSMPNFQQGGTYAQFITINENEVALNQTTWYV